MKRNGKFQYAEIIRVSTIVMSVHVHVVRWVANGNQFKKASLNTDT